MDSTRVDKIDQISRLSDLYFTLNQYATSLQMYVNYNRQSDMRAVFPNFRYCMIEMYYLVRFNDIIKSDVKFNSAMDTWLSKDLQRGISVKFCQYSLKLYTKFIEKLVQLGIIEDLKN